MTVLPPFRPLDNETLGQMITALLLQEMQRLQAQAAKDGGRNG